MQEQPPITVLILNYNGFELTAECLQSLSKSTYSPLSIIIVDNASTDDSVQRLRSLWPAVEILELKVNGGYSTGNNVGMEEAFSRGAQFVFVINNDTVIDPRCIQELYQAISSDEKIGIVGPKILSFDRPDTIQNAGILGVIPRARYRWIGLNEKDNGQYENLVDVLFQDGCALFISRACYEKIGGFDEWLWTYFEESDLCLRAHRAGFRVACCQKAKVWHKASATLGTHHHRKPHAVYYMIRNSFIFHRRYAGSRLRRLAAVSILLSRTPRYLAATLFNGRQSKWKNMRLLLAATWVGLTTDLWQPSDAFSPIKAVKRRDRRSGR